MAGLTTLWRTLLCLCCVASQLAHRHLVLCASGQHPSPPLLINTPSSALQQGRELHTFLPSSSTYQLIQSQDEDCPSDTFSLSGSSLVVVRNVTFGETMLSPVCAQDTDSEDGFPSIRTHRCLVVINGSVGIPFTVNVQPEFHSAGLTFQRAFYVATVVEGMANATLSLITPHLEAQTRPVAGLLVPRYRVAGQFSGMFGVRHEQVGCVSIPVLLTTEPLDRETQDYYEITLEAYAPYAPDTITASTLVGIRVLDINDNAPQFTGSPPNGSQVSVNDTILPGTGFARYFTTDPDLNRLNREARFSLPTPSPYFTVHPLTGTLYPFKSLATLQSPSSEVQVQGQDSGVPTLFSPSRTLRVFVAQVSSDAPQISIHGVGAMTSMQQQAPIVGSVSELAAEGDQVTTVDVTNQDSTGLSLLLSNVSPCECFALSSPTSIASGLRYTLQVAGDLDFELNPEGRYQLVLTALDRSNDPVLTSTAELWVQVTDENDTPYFPRSSYDVEIAEGVPVGSIIGQTLAMDPDSGTNGTLTYSLSDTASFFGIDSTSGLVYTMAEIDFESLSSPQFTLTVTAEDGNGSSTTTSLTISVTDRNDNSPSFLPSSTNQRVEIPEGYGRDEVIFQFVVEDSDSGCNGAVEYLIVHADPDVFSLGASSGLLYPSTESSMNYESFQSAVVVVRVQDLGRDVSFSAETTLFVSLVDVNDEAPVVDPIECPCFITENASPSSPEARCPPLSAHDEDAGSTSLIFAISSGDTTLFQVDPSTGVVSIRTSLDRETASTHRLEVTASDGVNTSPPMLLTVTVVDVNDMPPSYSGRGSATVYTIPTDSEPGYFVGDLGASDADVGYNSLVSHVMEGEDTQTRSVFLLDPLSGLLHTRTTLPPSRNTYTFTSSARSLVPNEDTRDSISVTVQVSGLKNNPPRFALPVDRHTIPTGLTTGSRVARAVAMDGDSGSDGELVYTIVEETSNHSGLFQMESSGTLRLVQSVSGRVGEVFAVNVSVSDGAAVPLRAHQLLLVSVYAATYSIGGTELVYNPSVSPCHLSGSVEELLSSSTSVLSLPRDQDFVSITYRILDQEQVPASAFRIVQDGYTLEAQSGFSEVFSGTVFITLVAEYHLNFHFCSVTVAINDINNNPPLFPEDAARLFRVYSSTPMDAAVFQVTATDADFGTNAETRYSIESANQVPFSIDPDTGIIRVSGALGQPTYTIPVTAVDPGLQTPPSPSATPFLVTAEVLGVTNQRAMFSSPTSPLTIQETRRGVVAAAVISDGDGDTNPQATNTFCIASGNLRGALGVTRMGGERLAMESLDFETLPHEYNITLMAYDVSSNPTFGLLTIQILLLDQNEPPAFSLPIYRASVREGDGLSLSVINVTAVDEDVGSNGAITYSLPPGSLFSIDMLMGAITTSSNLNRENQEEIIFNVTASDDGNPRLSAMAEVRVTLTDVNDQSPTLQISTAPRSVEEDTPVGSEIVLIEATDRDTGANSLLRFTIVSGNTDRFFLLEPWTGSLRLARALDFELGPRNFTLTLRVEDLGTPATSPLDFTLITTVTDSNDQYPLFSSAEYDCSVTESFSASQQAGSCQVSAIDADRSGNTVSFSLLGNPPFTIDPTSGVITQTANSIPAQDRLRSPAYILRVQARDSHAEPKISTAIVRVSIIDVNDIPSIEVQGGGGLVFFEGAPRNTLLWFAHMHDVDSSSNFSTITYGIQGQSQLFRLDGQTGAVFLDTDLDYETMASPQTVTIIGTNSEHESLTSNSLRYEITIGDVNENFFPPEFLPEYNPPAVSLSRATPIGSSVLTLNATDPEGQSLRYDIVGGTGVGYFQVDSSSGQVTTAFSLTAVESSRVSLVVRVLDDSTFPLPAWHEISITLTSELSLQPHFTRPVFTADPSESSTGVVAFVRAELDGLSEEAICYSLHDYTEQQSFSIDQQTGAVSLNTDSSLDREERPLYNLTVRAGTAGVPNASLALLVIQLTDHNDFRPNFDIPQGSFNFTTFTNVLFNETWARVFAVDNDVGRNGELTYTMTTVPENSPFVIASGSGELSVTRVLDRMESSVHILTVMATDGGSPPLSSEVSVTVIVEPTPIFSQLSLNSIPTVTLSENTPPGTLITTAARSSTPGAVVYRIQGQPSTVSILPSTGEIYLTGPLDYETNTVLTFMVEGLDGVNTDPPIATLLRIDVTDENDNRPTFNREEYTFEVMEGMFREGVSVGRIEAFDMDISNVLTYSLIDSTHPSSVEFFTVNASTGMIRGSLRAGEVDRETLPLHALTVAVSDNGSPPLWDFVTVTITVQDANDHAPQFTPSDAATYLTEDTPLGEVVYKVSTFDPDEGTNSDIEHELLTMNTPFTINATSGDIMLATPLDAEQQLVYSLEIRAFNPNSPQPASPSNLNLTVYVVDVLDSPPELMVEPTATVRENYPAYSRVTQIQLAPSSPSRTPRQVYFSIIGGNTLGRFLVEPLTGVVRTTVPLDREETESYQLLIQGAFGAGFESNVTLAVSVEDANDESPQFTSPYVSLQIPENSHAELSLARLSITDLDEGTNGRISSVVISDSFAGDIFSIDPSGNVSLKRDQWLDREGRFSEIRFTVYAIDSGTTQRFSTADVRIEITDLNDPPRFAEPEYSFTLSTPVLVGTPQFRVQAEDEDVGSNSEISYSISGEGGNDTFFVNPTTGDISVFDNFMLRDSYLLVLVATDGGGLEATANLNISVRPCNFMNLTFSPSSAQMSVSVLENASVSSVIVSGADLRVTDLNTDRPSIVFSLPLGNSSFSIDLQTGDISIVSLDREARELHRLVVQAADSADSSRVAQATVLVTVLDVNDNPPVFDQPRFSTSITTDASVGDNLIRVPATDPDLGPNAEVTYSIASDPLGSFSIEPSSGVLSLTSDVSRLGTVNELVVRATDGGEPPMSSTVTVTVNVVDPRAPRFSQDIYSLSLSENTPIDTPILTVMLANSSQGGAVSFRFINTGSPFPFSISAGGVISLVDPGFNFEVRTNYTLTLRARDSMTLLDGFATVQVQVEDFNDNTPLFTSFGFYSQSVLENATIGTTITQVSAEDSDSGLNAEIFYQLGRDPSGGLFSVVPSTGEIVLSGGQLDYERNTSHTLEVLAVDGGSPPLTGTATVVITVGNINDRPPAFGQLVYRTFVRDDDMPRRTNLFVSATDPDQLGNIQYNIEGEGGTIFSVSSNGLISLSISNPAGESYTLNVSAFDGVFFGFATVLVSVEGTNSAPPIFDNTTYTAVVQESSPSGVFVLRVSATDPDRGTNGQVTYALEPTETRFAINSSTGTITTTAAAAAVDHEATPTFNILVAATDGGGFSTLARISILVGDENDGAPRFDILEYNGTVVDNAAPNTNILTVTAFDPDTGENARITYSIVGSSGIYVIDPGSGVVTNVVEPNIESPTTSFTVTARDNGDPPMNASVTTTVTITVVEDGTPMPYFEQNPYREILFENARIGTEVVQVVLIKNNATCQPTFMLQGDTTLFELQDGNRIVLISTQSLMVRNYTLRVRANCVYTMPSFRTVTPFTDVKVSVREVNEPPVFQGLFFPLGTVAENTMGFVNFSSPIVATDPDPGNIPDGMLVYSLAMEDRALFDVTPQDGRLVTRTGLDFEAPVNEFTVTVFASDMGTPPLSGSIMVLVRVTDENDHPPMFNQSSYSASVREDATAGTRVHTATATDIDANSNITYTISGTIFTIDKSSGEIRVAEALDRETTSSYTVEITAFDQVNTTSAELVVTVTDINDNAPVFNQTFYEATLPENYPTGHTFIAVFATDDDEGLNAVVSYEQILTSSPSANSNISVNSSTGEISFLASPDREEGEEFTLSIQAIDSGVMQRQSSTVSVIVRLLDENDNAPWFTQPNYTAGIRENLPPGTTVEVEMADRVEADDPDNRENGTVSYAIHGEGAGYFSFVNGDILSRVEFDREMNSSVEIIVVATDRGVSPFSSNVTVLIHILDQNDNAPMFSRDVYMIRLSEDTMVGILVFNVSATDLDSGNNAAIGTYGISGENSNNFRFENDDGVMNIFLRIEQDHEDMSRREYELTLVAFDSGQGLLRGNATLQVSILDVNEHSPRFIDDPYTRTVHENVTVGTVLVRVNATDSDASDISRLVYSLRNSGNHQELVINESTGEISVSARGLDFESAPQYALTVVVSDTVREGTASVTITVLDVNDNPPRFLPHAGSFSVRENNEAGFRVTMLETEDADVLSDAATRTFSIMAGNIGNAFTISRLGELTAEAVLDREVTSRYNLMISATDNGSPSLTGSTNVLVDVLDVNDNSPTGGHQEIFLNLLKGVVPVIPLGAVFVNDSDLTNSHRYMLLPSTGADNIKIDDTDGSIRVSSGSPRVGTYSFVVTITDVQNTSANTTISVTIRDVSELTLSSSFRMQFRSVEPQDFVDNHFSRFLSAAKTVIESELSSGSVDLQALSIQPSMPPPFMGNTDVTLAVRDVQNDIYLLPLYVQHILHVHRRQLEEEVGVAIATVSVDACSQEPCEVGETCVNAYSETLADSALGSQSITYLGVASTLTHSCVPVSASPCEAASCPGASSCRVVGDRSGSILAQCTRDCSTLPCRNGGECFDQSPGYYCRCPRGYNGRNCKLTSASFSRTSYAVFPALTSRTFGGVAFEFSTNSGDNTMLLHSGRFDSTANDSFSVYFEDSQACLFVSRGGGVVSRGCVQSWGETSQGQGDSIWHTISIQYNSTVSATTSFHSTI